MSLKINVKVGEINNLSDARYCAGMGVEMVGFSLIEENPKFLPFAKIIEISNWLNGVKLVGEVKFLDQNTVDILNTVPFDYIQFNYDVLNKDKYGLVNIPLILKIDVDKELQNIENILKNNSDHVALFLFESNRDIYSDEELLIELCKKYKIYLAYNCSQDNLGIILNSIKPAGISMNGGNEIKPGLMNFEHLSTILELLDSED